MLIWSQSKGELRHYQKGDSLSGPGQLIGAGYSGRGEGRNNPDMQGVPKTGPIPRGSWRIGPAYDSTRTGPMTIPLYKIDANPKDDIDDSTGRSAFRIHGDNAKHDASEGCIILPRISRQAVDTLNAETLMVVT